MRCEVDAYLPKTASSSPGLPLPTPTPTAAPASAHRQVKTADLDSLTDQLSGLGLYKTTTSADARRTQRSADINVIHAGSIVSQSDLVELTTRSKKSVSQFDWTEQYPQLLLTWVPYLFLCVHDNGVFQRMVRHQLGTPGMSSVNRSPDIQRGFRQLVAVLKVIQELAREHGRKGRLSLVSRDGRLEVFECTESQGFLKDEELERFGV